MNDNALPRVISIVGGSITTANDHGTERYFLHAEGRNEPVEVSRSYAVQQYEEAQSQAR